VETIRSSDSPSANLAGASRSRRRRRQAPNDNPVCCRNTRVKLRLLTPTQAAQLSRSCSDPGSLIRARAILATRGSRGITSAKGGVGARSISSRTIATPPRTRSKPNCGLLSACTSWHAVVKPYSFQLATLSALTANADGESSCRTPFRCRSRSPRPTNRSTAACAAA
jgi:hypothetical protein